MSHWSTLLEADENGEKHLDATTEQLYDCVSLLALSLVHHRAKFGLVPFEHSVKELGSEAPGPVLNDDIAEGRKILQEALALIKASAGEQINSHEPKLNKDGSRQQIRIKVSAPIYVMPDNSISPLKAKLDNISWGGATLRIDQPLGDVGDLVHVELPSFSNYNINVRASILRISDIDGELQYSLRFIKLKTDDEEVFQQLLGFLADSGDDDSGQRKNARLAQRIDIQYDNTNDLKATLEDISSGGMGITVPEPMELNQSLLTVISTTDQKCQLALRARVVRQESGDSSNIEVFRVGLEFEHSTEDLQHRINKLIRKIASTNPGNNI